MVKKTFESGPPVVDLDIDPQEQERADMALIGFENDECHCVDGVEAHERGYEPFWTWKLKLESGLELRLIDLDQTAVYASQLTLPMRGPRVDMARAVAAARRRHPAVKRPPVFLKPVLTAYPLGADITDRSRDLVVLPPIRCIALFDGEAPAGDSGHCFGSVVVIWFQARFGLPDELHTLDQLRKINWNERAQAWTP